MAYEPSTFVEPLGYQPVEFLDIPSMRETRESWAALARSDRKSRPEQAAWDTERAPRVGRTSTDQRSGGRE